MTTGTELLERARRAGLEVCRHGDKVRVRGRDPLPGDIVKELKAHKTEVLVALVAGPADRDLALRCGLEGSRQQFLDAVELVAELSGEPWPRQEAMEDLRRWWGRDPETLSAVEWIVSAAHADEVRRAP